MKSQADINDCMLVLSGIKRCQPEVTLTELFFSSDWKI